MEHLQGKVAFVSGAGKNIGRAVALAFARHGVRVIVNGRADRAICEAVVSEIEALGGRGMVLMGDVGRSETVRDMAAAAIAEFGRVDIVVNNAAIRPQKPFLEMSDDDWHGVLDVDLHAAFYTARAFAPAMVEAGWGRIINFAGMNAIHGYAGRAPVSAAKHGVWGLTKSLGKELGPKGITVNAISPGPIESDHADPAMTQHIQSQLGRIPGGRLGTPDDIAGLALFLASRAGGFVNAQMIAANGGAET